jgi:hypothetical protein
MRISPIFKIICLVVFFIILAIIFIQYLAYDKQPSNITMLGLILAAIFFSKECCCHVHGYQPKTKLDTTNPPKQQKN